MKIDQQKIETSYRSGRMANRIMWAAALLLFSLLSACSKTNPNACCTSATDCEAVGLSTVTSCGSGETCVNHACTAETCDTTGCTAATPVCNTISGVCEGCVTSDGCASYSGQPVCDSTSGQCVECVAATDCPNTAPVCDMHSCRTCTSDSECASGACDPEGRCIAGSAIVYVDANNGHDAGTCTASTPCASISYAISQTNASRGDVVLASGIYTDEIVIDTSTTSAGSVVLHGGGATLMGTDSGSSYIAITVGAVPTTIVDLTFVKNPSKTGAALDTANGACVLKHVRVNGVETGIGVGADVSIFDSEIDNADYGIIVRNASHLTVDRIQIRGGNHPIYTGTQGATVDIKNMLVADTTAAVALQGDHGTIQFATFARVGTAGSSATSVNCSQGVLTLDSSIVWAPQAPAVSPIFGCTLNNDIIGPFAVAGASSSDPKFVDESTHDYHLAPGSPARDVVDSGPPLDFEGDARPQASRYDIGADEAM